jgi:prepilin-type N-terminal cleavage/methylation domain-containing protein
MGKIRHLIHLRKTAVKPPSGFTVIELMVVIAIIGVIMALAIPAFSTMQKTMRIRAGTKSAAQNFRHVRERALATGRNYQITKIDSKHYQITDPDGRTSVVDLGHTTGGNLQFGTTGGIGVTPPEANIANPDGDGFDFDSEMLIFQARGASSKGVLYINDGEDNYAIGINQVGKIRIYHYVSGAWIAL